MTEAAADSVAILQDLVRCPSVTPAEAGALTVLENLLSTAGFRCQRLIFKEEGTADVENLFARIGKGSPHLCFAGHVDVVPPGREEDWTHPPFEAEIAEGFLYGRGATDMKGSVAAFAAAAIDYVNEHPKFGGSLSFLITCDEEGPAINGTVKLLQWMKETGNLPDHCIVGEPSCTGELGDAIKIGRRGSISVTVTVEGRQGHTAYPQKADNPIPKIARFIDRIATAEIDAGDDHFDPTSLAFTSVDVGNAVSNVIPARAMAKFNIRYNTSQTAESLRALIDGHIAEVAAETGGTWSVAMQENADAFITEPGTFVGLVQDAIHADTGVFPRLSTSGGTSDARFIKDYCPVLEFGPTNATIHMTDERIAIAELRKTQSVYTHILDSYFSNPP